MRERVNNRSRLFMIIFLAALLVRGMLFFMVLSHEKAIFQPDSGMYVSLAEGLRQHGAFCYPRTPDKPHVERVPGYPFFLYLVLRFLGGNYLMAVAIQAFLDALTCVFIGILADTVRRGAGLLSGLLAAVNLNMITYAHFVLTDSLFLFLFTGLLILVFRFLRGPSWMFGAAVMGGLGLLTLIRPIVFYLPILLVPFMAACLWIRGRRSFFRSTASGLVWVIVFLFVLFPWLHRNYRVYGRFALTSQTGQYFLHYVVPFVWQHSEGTPFIEGMKKAVEAFRERLWKEGLDPESMDPFEISDHEVETAMAFLRDAPKSALVKAWLFGMVKNLFSPALVDLSYLLEIERPHFFYTEGRTPVEQVINFLRNMPGIFGWALLGSLAVTALSRLIQLWGLVVCLRRRAWDGLLIGLFIGYFLMVSGPIGYAKYRLPFEPLLIILLAIGLLSAFGGRRASVETSSAPE